MERGNRGRPFGRFVEFDSATSEANCYFKSCYSSGLFLTEMEESKETLTCFCSKAQDILPAVFLPQLNIFCRCQWRVS